MPERIVRDLEPIGDFSLYYASDEREYFGIYCSSEINPFRFSVRRPHEDDPWYILGWPSSLDAEKIVEVFRKASPEFGADSFTCIQYDWDAPASSTPKKDWKDGKTLDEVIITDEREREASSDENINKMLRRALVQAT